MTPEDLDSDLEWEQEGSMPWQSKAEKAVDSTMFFAHVDEISEVIILSDRHDGKMKKVCQSVDEVRSALTDVYLSVWHDYLPYDTGEAVFEADPTDTIDEALRQYEVAEFFRETFEDEYSIVGDANCRLVTASELLRHEGSKPLRIDASEINDELIRYLAKHPEKMHDLSPRKFEELIAELFKAKGYDVQLCRRGADGGVDVFAVEHTAVGAALTLIQCKKYSPTNPVRVSVIRELYGLVESKKATAGLIATTSYFTRSAKAERETVKFRMGLADHEKLIAYLKSHKQT